ncbi:hypothetical protein CDD83_3998 [Cordyceps sp. RAO-2017]|nr:hypothetical protein CDD83_3998 [Cordyceps sp. RAO-2017]
MYHHTVSQGRAKTEGAGADDSGPELLGASEVGAAYVERDDPAHQIRPLCASADGKNSAVVLLPGVVDRLHESGRHSRDPLGTSLRLSKLESRQCGVTAEIEFSGAMPICAAVAGAVNVTIEFPTYRWIGVEYMGLLSGALRRALSPLAVFCE